MKKSSGLTPRAPDTSNQSESALKKTLQKLLKTRSSKVNRKLEKDLRRSSSQWQSYTQKPVQSAYPAPDEPVLENDLPPVRQPRLSADTEEVCMTDTALTVLVIMTVCIVAMTFVQCCNPDIQDVAYQVGMVVAGCTDCGVIVTGCLDSGCHGLGASHCGRICHSRVLAVCAPWGHHGHGKSSLSAREGWMPDTLVWLANTAKRL